MSELNVNWDKEQFKAYLLIYAAQANFNESEEEKELILSKVDPLVYKQMHRELEKDNDYQRLEKILYCVDKFGFTKDDLAALRAEVKQVINAEGSHDELEDNMFLYLKKLLS
jgi:hypothetical protein